MAILTDEQGDALERLGRLRTCVILGHYGSAAEILEGLAVFVFAGCGFPNIDATRKVPILRDMPEGLAFNLAALNEHLHAQTPNPRPTPKETDRDI